MIKKPELLLPAGSLDRMKTAFLYGADAVYCGTPSMSLRAKSKFTIEEVKEGIELANKLNKKVYLTLNLIAHNSDLNKLPEFAASLKEINPHGVIVADVAVFKYLKENVPSLHLHVSTQSNVCSWLGVQFWKEQGASMCVLGREVSISELKEIREKCPDIKLETFIHGSMCMSYSGRCLLSNFMANRGANQGKCAHSCRWSYQLHMKLRDGTLKDIDIDESNRDLFEFLLEEETRPGQFLEIDELNGRSHILNSKDLCLIPRLNEFVDSGIDCLKIEGRNKTQYYVALVAKTYRTALDDYLRDPQGWDARKYLDELYTISNRGFSLAFADDNLTHLANNYYNTKSTSEFEFAGYIQNIDEQNVYLAVKNKLQMGDTIEFVSPCHSNKFVTLSRIIDSATNLERDCINAGQQPVITLPIEWFDMSAAEIAAQLPVLTVARKQKNISDLEKARIDLDKETFNLELGLGSTDLYNRKLQVFKDLLK